MKVNTTPTEYTGFIAMVYFLILLVVVIVCFIWAHTRPLNSSEVEQLAKSRRSNYLKWLYSFSSSELAIDVGLKKAMPPNGSFVHYNESLDRFPSFAAALLKYKKHEWVLLAFEKDQVVNMVWINKGFDNQSVTCLLSESTIERMIRNDNYSTIMRFHNHPNPDPGTYNCTQASHQDHISAKYYAELCMLYNIAYIDFVCERGRHYEFYRNIPDAYANWNSFVADICALNEKSKYRNFVLHLERIFNWNGSVYFPDQIHELSNSIDCDAISSIQGYRDFRLGMNSNDLDLSMFHGPFIETSASLLNISTETYVNEQYLLYSDESTSVYGNAELILVNDALHLIMLKVLHSKYISQLNYASVLQDIKNDIMVKNASCILEFDTFENQSNCINGMAQLRDVAGNTIILKHDTEKFIILIHSAYMDEVLDCNN